MYLEEMSEYSVMKKAYCTVFHVGICRKVGEQIPARSRGQIGYLVCWRVTGYYSPGTRGPPFSHPKIVTSKICQDLRAELDLPLV